MMMRTVLLVSLAALTLAQTPSDTVVVGSCTQDSECQLTDGSAKCLDTQCDCTDIEDRTKYCTKAASGLIQFVISFIWGDGDCSLFDAVATETLRRSLLGQAVFSFLKLDIVCGSVIAVTTLEATAADLDTALQSATDQVVSAQAEIPAIANSSLTTSVVVGEGKQQCVVDNAASTVLIEGMCFPTCNQGFDRVDLGLMNTTGTSVKVYECQAPSTDDELSATGVAAVVVACLLFCGVIGAIVYYVVGKPNSEVAAPHENEPFNEEKEEQQPQADAHNDITV